ncbi:MAG: ACP S-malonyltransferase [Vulcanimicrobiaceae bacterium]
MRIGVVFPGQGSQTVGMGGDLPEREPAVGALFERSSALLGYDLRALLRDGPEERLRETRFSQPAIFVLNYALALAAGPALAPVASAGHSFGEYCSLVLAGALEFEVALRLVSLRGSAMQEAAERRPGAMAAVLGIEAGALEAAIRPARASGSLTLANFNAPGQIVLSGDRSAVERAGALALQAGAKRVVLLNVSGAWHSELMAPAQERFAPAVAAAQIELPRFPVISNVDAQPYNSVARIRENLSRSLTAGVLWNATAQRLVVERLDLIVEFGGSAVLSPLLKRQPDAPEAISVTDAKGLARLAERCAATAGA